MKENEARFYDPSIGRFLTPNPAGTIDSPNLYAYVLNDPINLTDPSGLCETVTGSRICRSPLTATDTGGIGVDGAGGGGRSRGRDPCAGAPADVICIPGRGGRGGGGRCTSSVMEIGGEFVGTFCRGSQSSPFPFPSSSFIHTGLGIAGLIPGIGTIADLADAGLYLAEGDIGSAALSAASAIPLAGDAAGVAKLLARACGCFVAGTLVATPDGLVPIETIGLGDLVLAYDEASGQIEAKPVVGLIRPTPKETFLLAMTDAQGEHEEFEASADHPWLVRTSDGEKRWVETAALAPGDRLLAGDGETLVLDAKTLRPALVATYNLTVADYHTFLVGDDGVVVHNARGPCPFAQIAADLIRKGNVEGTFSVFRRGPDGKINGYQTFDLNPQNPNGGFQPGLRFRLEGGPHGPVQSPLIIEPNGRARPALPGEIPR